MPEEPSIWELFTPGVLRFLWTLVQCAIVVVVVRAILGRLVGAARNRVEGAMWAHETGRI